MFFAIASTVHCGVNVGKKPSEPINKLCHSCIRTCKQPESMLLLTCPRYRQRPFASQELRFRQLDLFDEK
jgi:hypothetical protein